MENRQQLGRVGAAPLVDDSQGPIDPADLAAGEAASGPQRVAGVADAGDALSALSLGGFCPVSFVKRGGLLAPVDPLVGLVRQVIKQPCTGVPADCACACLCNPHLHAPLPTPCPSLLPWQALSHISFVKCGGMTGACKFLFK